MNTYNDRFIKACFLEETDQIPVWFMRQAGRYQSAYRDIRSKYSIKEICKIPEICHKVTHLPVDQFNLDAAILFSDIMIPLEPMGVDFDYKPGIGPVMKEPVRSMKQIKSLIKVDVGSSLSYTGQTLNMLKDSLKVPCIGFIGAPFTLASYMIEGGPSKNYRHLKAFMYTQKDAWHLLMEKLTDLLIDYSLYQISSGASAMQIFDSWVGCLNRDDYKEYVLPYMKKITGAIKAHTSVPVILFGVQTQHLFSLIKEAGSDVIGVDWRSEIHNVWKNELNFEVAVQGNLDPCLLFADWPLIEKKAQEILEKLDRPGFIFNLGHGILPGTPEGNVKRLASFVQEYCIKV